MNFLMAILNRLQDVGIGIKGANLFLNQMPANSRTSLVLLPPLTGNKIDWELPFYRRTSFQVIVRSSSHEEGEAMATQAMNALTMYSEQDIGGFLVKQVLPRHEPVSYPLSEGNNIEWSVNFDATYVIV